MLETLRVTPIQYLALSKTAVTLTDLSCLLVPETNLPYLKKVYYQPLSPVARDAMAAFLYRATVQPIS